MAMLPQLWSQNGLSVELKIDRQTIARKMAKVPHDGYINGSVNGIKAWYMVTAVPALYDLRAKASDRNLELNAERARLAREQADQYEMKNEQLRGNLLLRDDVTTAMQASFSNVKQRLLTVPTKAAPAMLRLRNLSAIKAKLTELIHEALGDLANTEVIATARTEERSGGAEPANGRGGNGMVQGTNTATNADH